MGLVDTRTRSSNAVDPIGKYLCVFSLALLRVLGVADLLILLLALGHELGLAHLLEGLLALLSELGVAVVLVYLLAHLGICQWRTGTSTGTPSPFRLLFHIGERLVQSR